MLELLSLAVSAIDQDSQEKQEKMSDFQKQYSGLFTYDIDALCYSAQLLRSALKTRYEQSLLEDGRVCGPYRLVGEIFGHGIMERFQKLLMQRVPLDHDIAFRLEKTQLEAIAVITMVMKGSTREQLDFILELGISNVLVCVLDHPRLELRLAVLKILTMVVQISKNGYEAFEAIIEAVRRSVNMNELVMIHEGLRAIKALFAAHPNIPWERLSKLIPVLKRTLCSGNLETERLSLLLLRELTSSSSNVNAFMGAQVAYKAGLLPRLVVLMSSLNRGPAHDASAIIRSIFKAMPGIAEELIDMECIQGFFNVLGLLRATSLETLSDIKIRAVIDILQTIKCLTKMSVKAIAKIKSLKAKRYGGDQVIIQRVPLILALSKSENKEISKVAVELLKAIFSPEQQPSLKKALQGDKFLNKMINADELSFTIANFLASVVPASLENIEIEAKFGKFIDKSTNNRVQFPILTETVLEPGKWYRFDSNLNATEHATFNKMLNKMVGQPDRRWQYQHTKTVDSIISKSNQVKLRVTQDETRTKVLETMAKTRLGDIAILLPSCPLDVRISVNLEQPLELTVADSQQLKAGNVESERFKDRRSYLDTASSIRYDLTEVNQRKADQSETKLELELESVNIAELLRDPSLFINEIRGFSAIIKRK